MIELQYSQNWNNKLDCDCFTTVRLASQKHQLGHKYNIFLNKVLYKKAIAVSIRSIKLHQVTEELARIDTGYNKEDFKKLIITMYSKYKIDWEKKYLVVITLKTLKE
ncbi:hypothetical protein GOQ04_14885 [Emticicia sp. ODNR4P]|nr:hypothetical protein [Emticicia sp. ODNR4P]